MNEFKKEKKYNFWHSPVFLIILFCIIILFLYNLFDLFQKQREVSKKRELIEAEIDSLKEREKILSSDIEKLQSERGIEKLIREKYQVTKSGEKMIVIVNEEKASGLNQEEKPKHGFINWLKSVFQK